MAKNPGFDPEEIEQLKRECKAEKLNFVFVSDELEEDEDENNEHAHIQFVGWYKDKEVIFDALIYTLRLHHSTLVYDAALERLKVDMPDYVSPDEREDDDDYDEDQDEEAEILLTEFIEEIEENEEIKVKEHVEMDTTFEYGIGLEVGLNKTEINNKVISEFIIAYNAGRVQLDSTMFSFTSEEEDEE